MNYPNIDISEDLQVTQINANLERGGWQANLQVMNDTDLLEPYHFIQLYWRGMFGSEDPTSGMVGFQGHVLPLQFTFDHSGSLATYVASTTDQILKRGWLQGIHFIDMGVGARAHYHQFDNTTGAPTERGTMGRIVRHILGYYDELGNPPATNPDWVAHTNLVYHATQNPHGWITLDNVMMEPFDAVANPEGSMRVDHYIVRETNDLWTTIQTIAKNEFFVAYFDKLNNFWYCRHPMYQSTLPNPVMTFDEDFSVGKPVVYPRNVGLGMVRQVRLGAVEDDGSTLRSNYPASPTYVYGQKDEIFTLRCNDQDTLDEWARTLYLYDNRDYTVHWYAPGVCGLLFELLDRVEVTYTGTTANGVHVDWTEKKFWIHDITIVPSEGFGGITRFILEAENVEAEE